MNAKRLIMILLIILLLTIAILIPYYNLAAKNGRTVSEYTASIETLIFLGDYAEAVTECSDGLRHYPENSELYILKARAYLLSGDTAKAVGTLDYGYKQTQSGDILEQRALIAVTAADDAGFDPLNEVDAPSENPDNPSVVTDDPSVETAKEPYYPDSPIRIIIPNIN